MAEATAYFSARTNGEVRILEFSRADVTDAAYIKVLGDQIYAYLKQFDEPQVIIDFGKVSYLSSAALGMLIALNTVLNKKKGQLRLCNVNENIYEVFKLMKLYKLIKIFDSTEEAVASLK